ncbi:hypothetical protein CFBP2118_04437 [Pseudomonas syringae pv. syringae]|nr:hypothetical protein CFBP2118_04437 [Pseudomonas syringae pv. syringae]
MIGRAWRAFEAVTMTTDRGPNLRWLVLVIAERASNLTLLEASSQVNRDMDGSAPPADQGGSDGSYDTHVSAGLDGLGTLCFGAHSDNETPDMSSLPIATRRAVIFMSRY